MSYTGDQSMPRSCPSVSEVAGTAWGPLGTGVTPPASPPSGCIGVLPAMVRRLTWSREREEEHLPVGMWKERKGHLQAWGGGGECWAPLGAFSSVCIVLPPLQWVFSRATALLWSENYDQASGLLASELNPQLCPPDNGVLSAQDGHEGTRHGLVT